MHVPNVELVHTGAWLTGGLLSARRKAGVALRDGAVHLFVRLSPLPAASEPSGSLGL